MRNTTKIKSYLYQFIPSSLSYLVDIKKISRDDFNLKSAYIINIAHELLLKYYFTGDDKINLWSVILKKRYGWYYNKYIDFFIEKGYITKVSNYYRGEKANTYQITEELLFDVIRCKIYDKVLYKKLETYDIGCITEFSTSPISPEIRRKLISDLYSITINRTEAISVIDNMYKENDIDKNKYYRNILTIDGINCGNIFYKFDQYGRMHSNFTILKREIRKKYLMIEGYPVEELDIRNSQPFFLGILMRIILGEEEDNDDLNKYIDVVNSGIIYDLFVEKYPDIFRTRDDAKMMMYKVLFGGNGNGNGSAIYDDIFMKEFPFVYSFILDYKSQYKSYKELSHKLQKMESDFIYGSVVRKLYEKILDLSLFTVHDSIVYPSSKQLEVNLIFNDCINKLKENPTKYLK